MFRIGVDLGGTKIEAAAIAPDGSILQRRRAPTPQGYDETLRTVAALVTALDDGERAPVGVGHPGSASPETGLIRNANSTWLNGRPLARDLETALSRPVRLANDADCFALSEAVDGAGAGAHIVFGVILGTGVGGGVVIDGRLLSGAQHIAGEWGHNPLPWPSAEESAGPACWCGKSGCLETWLSGPGLAADHERIAGQTRSADSVFAHAPDDSACAASVERYAGRLARGLAAVINLLDPDVIVLGGGVSNAQGLPDSIAARLPHYVFSDVIRTRILRHAHGDSSGVRGAAWLWPAP